MGRRSNGSPPRFLHHKSTGQAFSNVAGKRIYFGRHGTEEAFANYQQFLKTWYADYGREIVARVHTPGSIAAAVDEFLREHAPPVYSKTEHAHVTRDLNQLSAKFGGLPPDSFRPANLKALRSTWVDAGNTRGVVNQRVGRIRRFFAWMVAHDDELCQAETLAVLQAVPPLDVGIAPEPAAIEPVPWPDVVSVLKVVPRRVRAMMIVQLYSGPRPSEICRMRGCEVVRGGTLKIGNRTLKVPAGIWLFAPSQHKTKKAGKEVVYILGPKCQAAIKPFLRADPAEFLFSPAEGRAEAKAAKRAKRKTKVQPSQVDRSKKFPRSRPGICYTANTYRQVIVRACEKYGVEAWHPHQLRHNFVTRMDSLSDLVTSSAAVGHSGLPTSLIYLQRKILDVAPIAAKVG